jgi:hypothetical protein
MAEIDHTRLPDRRAAAKRTALILGAIATTIFVLFILKATAVI